MSAPIVLALKELLGKPQFIKLQGKEIAMHSRVITNVCNLLGIKRTPRQNMIRLAGDNGK